MIEPVRDKPLKDMVEEAFQGMTVVPRETRSALLRQMIWDAFADQDVEPVIQELGMIPASSEVFTKEQQDSNSRLAKIQSMRPILGQLIDIMAQAQTAAMTRAPEADGVPDFVKHQVLHFNHQLIYSTVMSTISTLNSLGYINLKEEDGK